jgi:hypothetical protein
LSIGFLFEENPGVASAGLSGAAVGGARSVPDRAASAGLSRPCILLFHSEKNKFGAISIMSSRIVKSTTDRDI